MHFGVGGGVFLFPFFQKKKLGETKIPLKKIKLSLPFCMLNAA